VTDGKEEFPLTLQDLIYGGVLQLEAKAATKAVRETQAYWLPVLEKYAENLEVLDRDNVCHAVVLHGEIKRLRRALGIRQPPEERRAAVRQRVRRHRANRNAGIN
jgi:hypothetical protein